MFYHYCYSMIIGLAAWPEKIWAWDFLRPWRLGKFKKHSHGPSVFFVGSGASLEDGKVMNTFDVF